MTANFASPYEESVRLGARGQFAQALVLVERCLVISPENARALAQRGALLLALGRPAEAVQPLQRALSVEPDRADALNNLGSAFALLGAQNEALSCYRRAVEIDPGYFDARYNLGGALSALGEHSEAVRHFDELALHNPQTARYRASLGKALWKAGRVDDGIAALRRAIELDPQLADAYGQLGNALLESGQIEESIVAFERAIELAPTRGDFYLFLSQANPAAISAKHLEAMEGLAKSASATNGDADIELNFALGRAYAQRGERERAFRHTAEANALKRRHITYEESETLAAFERIQSVFDNEFLTARRACSNPAPWPVFIFGMPRSGTTLVEQILASHPLVYGAGELPLFEGITGGVITRDDRSPDALSNASCDSLREIGKYYAEALKALAPQDAQRITDKMPANFRYAGLISVVLPNSRMIHVRRDPVDTCLSCFTNHFAGDLSFAYDLAELGRYYRGYERLMQHWRGVLPPGAMLEVQYEDVVDDLETQARRIIAYCGLEWDPACLDFYKTDRPVRTASAAQVRRPIYKSSVGYSREYGDLLEPLLRELRS